MAFVETRVLPRYYPRALTPPRPFLSIVIPTWNGGNQLSATLAHIREFREGQEFQTEIVIVDDCSELSTAHIVRNFADDNAMTVVLRNETNRGKGHAVTRGMLHATGEYRIFVDSDLAYPSSQVTKLLNALESGSDVAIASCPSPAT